jgi:hypothetical protein
MPASELIREARRGMRRRTGGSEGGRGMTTEQTPEDDEHAGVFDPDDDPDNPYDPDKADDGD